MSACLASGSKRRSSRVDHWFWLDGTSFGRRNSLMEVGCIVFPGLFQVLFALSPLIIVACNSDVDKALKET